MTTPSGYEPSRIEMIAITAAARNLYRVIRRWQRYANLPGFPVERGNLSALRALYRLERALNPHRLAWGEKGRKDLPVKNWPEGTDDGIAWVRGLLDHFMSLNRLESIATASTFELWLSKLDTLPQTISFSDDEIASLKGAIRSLPSLVATDETVTESPAIPQARPATSPRSFTESASVALLTPKTRPFVLGRPKDVLTTPQFRVVKALLEAGDAGLSKSELQSITGDAVNVLKRLAKSDPDWLAVIHLPGRSGRKYRIGMPDDAAEPTLPYTASPTPILTTPHPEKCEQPYTEME